jgi:hypothetical protein
VDLDARASDVLAAEVVTAKKAGRWAAARLLVASVLLAIVDDGASSAGTPAVHGDLVVTRKDTGEVVLTVAVGFRPTVDESEVDYLGYVRRQLDELTAGEFLARWGAEPA